MSESGKQVSNMDIEAEVQQIDKLKSDIKTSYSDMSDELENGAMKDLGMKRGMDTFIRGYGDQTIPCFLGDCNSTIDVIPADMVVNAIMVAIATQWNKNTQVIYHVSSSKENQLLLHVLMESLYRYFASNGLIGNNANPKQKPLLLFSTYTYFIAYMFFTYKLPIEALHIVNLLMCGLFSRQYNVANKNYSRLMILAKMFAPYTFFKGRFDGANLTKLQTAAVMDYIDAQLYNFDPKCIDWASYVLNIHIPAIVNYPYKKKDYRKK
ncbi:hypothetical protein PR202_gb20400 [Eleusine coracana subsp. coracana]|uniref:Fatty acyl-CoA reductase C-terminal domain-containing protein n=1 Tax=Eleusine coracana subsp. coracana TaxID=191504 RepID=A0AAV5FAM5_ELECO|nr:hypothetical protein PR202_gb20400 [Eleusine coracana subsp. coracana]